MPRSHARSLETRARPDVLWRIWSDAARWPDWNPDVRAMDLNGPFAPGTTGTMTTGRGRHAVRVLEVQPGRAFALEAAPLPLARFVFRCEVVPRGAGATVRQGVTMRGPLGGLFSRLMGERVADSFDGILRALAVRAESEEA